MGNVQTFHLLAVLGTDETRDGAEVVEVCSVQDPEQRLLRPAPLDHTARLLLAVIIPWTQLGGSLAPGSTLCFAQTHTHTHVDIHKKQTSVLITNYSWQSVCFIFLEPAHVQQHMQALFNSLVLAAFHLHAHKHTHTNTRAQTRAHTQYTVLKGPWALIELFWIFRTDACTPTARGREPNVAWQQAECSIAAATCSSTEYLY